MPRAEVYEALPEETRRVMQETHIRPLINRRRDYCYGCEACSAEWSKGDSRRRGLFWWACPRGCNWETKPMAADIMRRHVEHFIRALEDEHRQIRRPGHPPRTVDINRVPLNKWSQYVDQLVADVHASHQDEPGEE